MQAYSVPERLTPRRRTVWLLPLRSLLPETCSPLIDGLVAAGVGTGVRPGSGKDVMATITARWKAMITRTRRWRGDIANNPPRRGSWTLHPGHHDRAAPATRVQPFHIWRNSLTAEYDWRGASPESPNGPESGTHRGEHSAEHPIED